MNPFKVLNDYLIKLLFGKQTVPQGLFDISEYFRLYEPIIFEYEKDQGIIIAKSTNFRWGTIITSAKNKLELDKNIKDAIFTAFEVPSSYSKEANICKLGSEKEKYALA